MVRPERDTTEQNYNPMLAQISESASVKQIRNAIQKPQTHIA